MILNLFWLNPLKHLTCKQEAWERTVVSRELIAAGVDKMKLCLMRKIFKKLVKLLYRNVDAVVKFVTKITDSLLCKANGIEQWAISITFYWYVRI